MEYKDLLEELLRALKISKKKFAEGLNLSQGNVSDWFNRPGYRPSIDALRKISQIYNVNLNWLITGTGSMFLLNDRARVGVDAVPPNPSPLHIPVVADIAAGNGIEAFDVEPTEYLDLPPNLMPLPGPYLAFKVQGDSMYPWIMPDDYAVVSTAWHDFDFQDRICAFRTLDGLLLKRFHVTGKGAHRAAFLMPLNPNHTVIKYTQDDPEYHLIGILLTVIRRYI